MADPFVFLASTNIQSALELDDRVVAALQELGLKCVDKRQEMCVAAAVETLADASRFHDIPLDRILAKLNSLAIVPRADAAGPAP